MTGKEIREEVDNYLIKTREERKNAGLAKVPEFDERDIKQAYRDGMQSGLWRHSYDYLVKTADLKKRYEMQKEINKELVDENEELKKLKRECETSLCRAEYQYNYEQLTKAKEIIREFVELATWQGSNCPSFKSIQDKAEQFLK